ncbi:hypothetical protein DFA_03965 [Cavenderia fasciculata]|uniref:Leucine-rich repeat-containing protein n=1 Tax=Cavenderia fasciculata TaxID=261658 RepID=F4Q0X0_CACFS|nr:uncharacterized protein DFA_03965 [Cavenderia fasciculata]EGG18471.1 hypothetical protein DFA_03965 [Cavenderia fasciculata]|eukprot:XP_004366375.1 hypothetical protein DFA_03965 [Cavenderia fasciculata]
MDLVSHGSSAFIASLKANTTLTELNLSRNFLKERDGLLLGEIIKHNNTLNKVDLSFNEFRISGLKSIIEALQYNHAVTDINLEAVCRLDSHRGHHPTQTQPQSQEPQPQPQHVWQAVQPCAGRPHCAEPLRHEFAPQLPQTGRRVRRQGWTRTLRQPDPSVTIHDLQPAGSREWF